MISNGFAQHISSSKEHLEMFIRIASHMLTAKDEASFMETILADIGTVMQACRCYIFEKEDSSWSNTYEWVGKGISPQLQLLQNIPLNDPSVSTMLNILSQGRPYVSADVSKISDTPTRTFLEEQNVHALITVPLFSANNISGMFGLDLCHYNPTWTEENTNVVIILGSMLNTAKVYFTTQRILQNKKEQIQALFDAFPYPLYIADMDDYSTIFYNKAMEKLCGASHILGQKCYQAFHKLDAPCPFCTNEILQKDRSIHKWHHHDPKTKKDFKIIECCITWEGLSNARMSVCLDISDSLRLQREQVLEREANIAKGLFLANMSHELRTPLNGIIGMTHLASTANQDANVQDYIEKIQLSSKNLLGIINDILDFSKLENNEITLENHPFSPTDILFETQAILQAEADRKGIHLSCHIDEKTPLLLNGDSLRLSQILLNLANNAIKFTNKGGVRLGFYAQEDTEKDCLVQLRVQDSGIGISEENLKKLFKEFAQADASTTRNYGGTGLGLTIVQKLVELMGGNVQVESVLGEGSSFLCTIPFKKVSEQQSKHALSLKPATDLAEEDIRNVRILLVEDNEINTLIATEVLEQYGCHVDCAGDGLIALQMLEKNTYHLVLMDIQMPNLDGIETTKRIRENRQYDTLPIVAMSAHALVQDREKSKEAGMQAHIIKPFIPQELRKEIYNFTHTPFTFSRL